MSNIINADIQRRIEDYQKNEKDTYFLKELEAALQKANSEDIFDRFYTELEFGTGGIRGIVGAGINRLNTMVVQKVALGWATYLCEQYPEKEKSVVIAFDSRNFSNLFSKIVTGVLIAKGIRVYVFKDIRPTPQLSFIIRKRKAQSGMVITASHNPPQYNGLKVYGDDGAQLVFPHDKKVMNAITHAQPPYDFPFDKETLDSAMENGLYIPLDSSYDEMFWKYVDDVLKDNEMGGNVDTSTKDRDAVDIVYTPLHGTGALHIEVLTQRHNIRCLIEPSQAKPDGDFPTVKFPNPEDPKALVNAIATAKQKGAFLVIANDPDADRVGLAEKNAKGKFRCFTGNQIGALLLDYVLSYTKKSKKNAVFINTIVTTDLHEKIACHHGIEVYKVYTGFKNIAMGIAKFETKHKQCLFACEESYGYMASMEVRDKDGISIALLCMQMALEYKEKGWSLASRLNDIYAEFGYHEERTINKVFTGKEGKDKIESIMHMLRNTSPTVIGSEEVVRVDDYLRSESKNCKDGSTSKLELEPSNVLIFHMSGGNKLCVRPSGTEPKIKFYLLYRVKEGKQVDEAKEEIIPLMNKAEEEVNQWVQ